MNDPGTDGKEGAEIGEVEVGALIRIFNPEVGVAEGIGKGEDESEGEGEMEIKGANVLGIFINMCGVLAVDVEGDADADADADVDVRLSVEVELALVLEGIGVGGLLSFIFNFNPVPLPTVLFSEGLLLSETTLNFGFPTCPSSSLGVASNECILEQGPFEI